MKLKYIVGIIFLCLALILVGGYFGYRQYKLQVADKTWIGDLGYEDSEIYWLTFHGIGDRKCPEIPVTIGEDDYQLLFDTGCGSGISFTSALEDKIDYSILGESEAFNRDGSHRGWNKRVIVDEFTVLGNTYRDIETTISDWKMYSSIKFNGAIGLAYFKSKIITLDYAGHRIGIKTKPIDYDELNLEEYTVLPLHKSTSQGQEELPFFDGELNGESVIVYLDTGSNRSFINNPDSDYSNNGKQKELSNIPLKIGDIEIILQDVIEVSDLAQADGLPYPTMVGLNSDQLWKSNLLVTFDLIEEKIIFRKL